MFLVKYLKLSVLGGSLTLKSTSTINSSSIKTSTLLTSILDSNSNLDLELDRRSTRNYSTFSYLSSRGTNIKSSSSSSSSSSSKCSKFSYNSRYSIFSCSSRYSVIDCILSCLLDLYSSLGCLLSSSCENT